MSSAGDYELDDLSKRNAAIPEDEKEDEQQPSTDGPKDDGVISAWAWASAGLLSLVALPLICAPKLVLFLADTERSTPTPLESFLAWNTGIILSAIAVALVINVPSSPEDLTTRQGAPGHPLLEPLSAACLLISFISYNTTSVGSLGMLLCIGTGLIGGWGFWAILFAGSSRISRKTGADKRTSRFLFGNKAAASVQKKRWKKEQAARAKNL
ncbi:hypothetical protein L226DRAFT_609053 [Lentinus tigrinus ALCF2SS1-7]|uniref:Uncharacterized protein n=1 Tax=Lentinus tigrinus ALCF2SS1-6 TaxID=1328759 RepID=A0A5C2SS21_9APHY|nr:hypothetical protein L227DRAFT_606290 [Lentinus tigrinus ALCF2SS1-6]RPD80090.1 hypothetical protein L226DRAFT_609053 [Lentinus tigrinus ALCF2SS1-7]